MKKKVIAAIFWIVATVGAILCVRQKMLKDVKTWHRLAVKNDALLKVSACWAEKESKGESLAEKLQNKGYKNVAIYGYGVLGERVCNALKDTKVCVECVVDKGADEKIGNVLIVKPEDICQQFDVLIVTAIKDFDAIKEEMETKVSCPVVSFEDLIYED